MLKKHLQFQPTSGHDGFSCVAPASKSIQKIRTLQLNNIDYILHKFHGKMRNLRDTKQFTNSVGDNVSLNMKLDILLSQQPSILQRQTSDKSCRLDVIYIWTKRRLSEKVQKKKRRLSETRFLTITLLYENERTLRNKKSRAYGQMLLGHSMHRRVQAKPEPFVHEVLHCRASN